MDISRSESQVGRPVYFSICDPDLERRYHQSDFEDSLLRNMLFQDGILVPDTFLFKSRGVESHVLDHKGDDKSLFVSLMEQGIVIPSFRDQSSAKFGSGLTFLENQIGRGNIGERAEALAKVLERVTDRPDYTFHVWPSESVGMRFAANLKRLLQRAMPPHLDSIVSPIQRQATIKMWNSTKVKHWRYECVEQAIDRTAHEVGAGLRRTELLTVIGHSYGAPPISKFYMIGELLPIVPEKDQKDLITFLTWVFECYQFTHATMFNAVPNFTKFQAAQTIIPSTIAIDVPPALTFSEAVTIHETVLLPSFEILKLLDPSLLVEIRKTSGKDYLFALRKWQAKPGDSELEKELRRELRTYSSRIVKVAQRERSADVGPILVQASGGGTPVGMAAKAAFTALSVAGVSTVADALELIHPDHAVDPLLVLGTGGLTAGYVLYYRIRPQRPRRAKISLSSPVELNVNVGDVRLNAQTGN